MPSPHSTPTKKPPSSEKKTALPFSRTLPVDDSPHTQPSLPPNWGKVADFTRFPMYRTTLPTTAGAGVPSDIVEVTLVYQFDYEQYELCRAYTTQLPRPKDGIFLIFPGTTPEEVSVPMRFDVIQVCHVLLDQSQVELGREYTVSNQVSIYVEPRDMTARTFCHNLVRQLREQQIAEGSFA